MQYNWGTLSAQSRHINTIEGVIPSKIRTHFPSHSLIMWLSTTDPWLYWLDYVPQLYCNFSVVLMMCLNYTPRFYWQCASVVLYTLWYTQSENVLRLYTTYSFWGLADSTLSRMSRISIKFLYCLYWGGGGGGATGLNFFGSSCLGNFRCFVISHYSAIIKRGFTKISWLITQETLWNLLFW